MRSKILESAPCNGRTMHAATFVTLIVVLTLSGCAGPVLIPTPNLYVDSERRPFSEVPSHFRNNTVDVLYATDRLPEERGDGSFGYGYGRSHSLAFGSAIVAFGEDVPWETLVEASRVQERDVSFPMSVPTIEEKGRFPPTPLPLVRNERGLAYDPEAVKERERVVEALREEIGERLSKTDVKEAYVFIHGYNNSFDYAVGVIGELWHFLGRRGIPIAYTWPAGKGGLRGYFYDRESGEFTIFHLKEFLRALRSFDELEKIHLIAHSRGTDVTLTALREIFIEIRGGEPLDPNREHKLANVILAAPDLDLDVIVQRLSAEEFSRQLARLTIYMSQTDAALGMSTWLFVSQKRVGRVGTEDVPDAVRTRDRLVTNVHLIDAQVESGFVGHSYFYSHPAVSSDLILLLRHGLDPGTEYGRPLEHLGGRFWRIDEDYPKVEE